MTDKISQEKDDPNTFSQREKSNLKSQLANCWDINNQSHHKEGLAVELQLDMKPDATISSVRIVDQKRYDADKAYHEIADSALRALKNKKCNPLILPLNKYNVWKDMTLVFDPKEMF